MSELEAADQCINYDHLLRKNLESVFNERNDQRRADAIEALFDPYAMLYEPKGIVTGRTAISQTAGALLEIYGPDFYFVPEGVATGHHGLGYLRWVGQKEEGRPLISGVDIAQIKNGKIIVLWVLLDTSDLPSR